MSDIPVLFSMTLILAAVLSTVSIWSPRRPVIKLSAIGATMLFLPVAYASMAMLLSRPKPISFEWWRGQAQEATVLSGTVRENEGIFLWLQLNDVGEPRSYVMPWDRELAEELQEALREADESSSAVRMRLPFEPSLDNRQPRFYALPQPTLPAKPHRTEAPRFFDSNVRIERAPGAGRLTIRSL